MKIGLIVIIASIAIGTTFGLLVQSIPSVGRTIFFTASAWQIAGGYSCAPIVGNYTEWLQIGVNGNRTSLNLNTVTVIDPSTRITLTMPLNSSVSAYVSYDPVNDTYETASVPLPDYWSPSQNLDVSLSYYFSGFAPITYSIGLTPLYSKTSISC